ncbi:DUF1173 family protein [Roseateles sp.]|uniref:DUF1173 family protein n=1 Tax=Roseateles sp. TaxID=1971397 RepID=UPI003BA952E9
MDADTTTGTQPAPQPQRAGGTVEPANRAAVAKEKFQTPLDFSGERFELRDPFAEVTYRAKTMAEITTKAEQIGSQRFTAIAEDGQRTPVTKVGTQWRRGEPLPAQPERPLDPGPAKGDLADTPTMPKAQPQPAQADAKALAKIESDAERSALVSRLEAALKDRYIIKNAPVSIGDVKIGHTEFALDEQIYRAIRQRFSRELGIWSSAADIRMVMIATFELRPAGAPNICGIHLMPVTTQWLPVDTVHEQHLVKQLVRDGRSFKKVLRYDLRGSSERQPCVALLDRGQPAQLLFA